ncbi:unnamed protein product [Acanthoscelides obtectus]|uniref:Uncharacterized protein n=1 Tax=Acanthoscelides obtectus TaxID=200917 RepID=A0A9P0KJG9_ACAOB|nr:unnamed protein product [Acanthoscelides obtectus]CAK1656512.1 hypothetical protein AOBTE_LOCUS19758 [Acanthoscelides obtectus]
MDCLISIVPRLTHSKMPFWICQQTSRISASKIGWSACRCVLIFV